MRLSSWNPTLIASVLVIGGVLGCALQTPGPPAVDVDRLVQEWHTTAAFSQRKIESFFCERYGWPHMMPIPPEDAAALQTAERPTGPASANEEGLWETRNHVFYMLGLANQIATRLRMRPRWREHTKVELGTSFVAWRSYLCSFTCLVDAKEHRHVWPEFYGLADTWANSIRPAARPCRM